MSIQAQVEAAETGETRVRSWSYASRVAFRFAFTYVILFCYATQILTSLFPIPKFDPSTMWPLPQIVFWTAAHVFGVTTPLVYQGSGSGDKTFDWVLTFCLLVIAALVTAVWSALDRKRSNYSVMQKWFRLFLRFALASQMFVYGIDKVIPLQMRFPNLTKLVEPFGNFSPMGVLWSSVGASPGYEIFVGSAEVLAGILLVIPRTVTLGALVCLADLIEIFMLNMTYDVPVKLFSFQLLVLVLLLLAPEFPRLARFFLLNRPTGPAPTAKLFSTRRGNRFALFAQIAFGIWMAGINLYSARDGWFTYGGGRAKSPVYGIWDVDELSIDGHVRSPLLGDYGRWRRAIFDFPGFMSFQRMDDSFVTYATSFSPSRKTVAFTKRDDKNWKADFTLELPNPDQLTLNGTMDGHKMYMKLRLVDRNKFLLVNRGFHWISEYPFNR